MLKNESKNLDINIVASESSDNWFNRHDLTFTRLHFLSHSSLSSLSTFCTLTVIVTIRIEAVLWVSQSWTRIIWELGIEFGSLEYIALKKFMSQIILIDQFSTETNKNIWL